MWRLGPMTIAVVGEGPVCDEVCAELSVLEEVESEKPAVVFRFVDEVEAPPGAVHVGTWRFGECCVAGNGAGYEFKMRRGVDGTYVVDVAPERRRRKFGDALSRAWDWNYLGPSEKAAKNFMYGLFDTVTALALLERGASYLHASSFESGGEATALVAWGGVGKTSSVLKLMVREGVRYLSDDLGLVDANGVAWRTPKRLQIYGYNVDGQRGLDERLLRGRGPVDRLNWHWRQRRFGPKKVRRRMAVEELFGEEYVAVSASMKRVVFLERADVAVPVVEPIRGEDMAQRAASILVDELETLFSLAVAAESHGVDVGIPTCGELRRAMERVLGEAFSGCGAWVVRVPVEARPEELAVVVWEVFGG